VHGDVGEALTTSSVTSISPRSSSSGRLQASPALRADSSPRVQSPFYANPGHVLFLRHDALLRRLD
jgi:hypothetical protein